VQVKGRALNEVTLLSVAGINPGVAIQAIERSLDQISFYDAKILTPTKPSVLPPTIKWEQIPELRLRAVGIDDYSSFVLYELHKFVQTEFCLVVQGDGYVIDGNAWSDEFLEYDYIGAPWPVKKDAYIDPFGNHQRVGNGGFSLRSRKLLQVPTHVDIPWNVNMGTFYKHMNAGSLAEDGNISVHNRHLFEAAGCKFAPLEVAMKFSRELPIPEYRGQSTFGFHRYL
jgi:hypothetical protein